MPKIPIIMNRKAGAFKITPDADAIRQTATELNLEVEIMYSHSPGEMRRLVKDYVQQKIPLLVVAGGDGTVHLAVQELVHSETVLGIIPQGTANNFATALHLPLDLRAALRVIGDGAVKKVSVGKVDGHYFTESAGVGLFADALAMYGSGTNKNLLKALVAFFRLLFAFPRSRIKVTLDGKEIVERAALCLVANSFRMGEALPIAPDAHLTDDILDVVIVGDLRRRELPLYYRALKAQSHPQLEKVNIYPAKIITIESLRHMNVHCDDHVIGTTPVTITIEPWSLAVLVEKI